MTNRPARITQAELNRVVRAARKAGATEVEVKLELEWSMGQDTAVFAR